MNTIPEEPSGRPLRVSTVSLPNLPVQRDVEAERPGRRFEKRVHGAGGRKIGQFHGQGCAIYQNLHHIINSGPKSPDGCDHGPILPSQPRRKLTPAMRKISPGSGTQTPERKTSNGMGIENLGFDDSHDGVNNNSLQLGRKASSASKGSGQSPVGRKMSTREKRDRKFSRFSVNSVVNSQDGCSRTSSMRAGPADGGGRRMSNFQKVVHRLSMAQLDLGSLKLEAFVPKKSPQILAALAATIGAFGMGTVMAWSSPALPLLQKDEALQPTLSEQAWIASLVPLAAAFAGPPAGKCIELIGRKPTMIALTVPFLLGWMLIAFAFNIPMILAGRALTGFCAGAFSLTAPVFISETAEASIRGTLGSGFQFMVTLGILFSYVVGAFVSWKWLTIISASVPVITCLLMIYVPASPRYLLSKGRIEEATKALMWFRGAETPDQVKEELDAVQASIKEATETEVKCVHFFSPGILKPLSVSLGLMFFQSFSGTDAVTFYTVNIFKDAGSSLDDNLATIIVGAVQATATFLSLILVDKAGRRALLLISDLFMAAALFALGAFFFLDEETKKICSLLPLVSLIVFVTAYSLGFGPVPWMMMGEVLPSHVIGTASAIATSFNWICTYLVIQFFADVKHLIGSSWCYTSFGICCIVGILYVFFCVPETKGKSLDEIQALFNGGKKTVKPSSRRVSKTTVDSMFFA